MRHEPTLSSASMTTSLFDGKKREKTYSAARICILPGKRNFKEGCPGKCSAPSHMSPPSDGCDTYAYGIPCPAAQPPNHKHFMRNNQLPIPKCLDHCQNRTPRRIRRTSRPDAVNQSYRWIPPAGHTVRRGEGGAIMFPAGLC